MSGCVAVAHHLIHIVHSVGSRSGCRCEEVIGDFAGQQAGDDAQDGQDPHGDAHAQGNFLGILEFGVELAEEDALGDLDEGGQGQHGGDQRNDADKDVEEVVALSALFKGCLVDVPLGGEAVEGRQTADGSRRR